VSSVRGVTAIESVGSHAAAKVPSDRSFAWLMTAIATAVAAYAHWKALSWVWWPVSIGALLTAVALFAPSVLNPLNRAWMQLGLMLGRVVTPLIMSLIFFGIVTPIAVLARWRGVNPMRRHYDPDARSYWIPRDPPGPDARSMERQF